MILESLKLLEEGVNILKFAVYRGKAHVCYLVTIFQLLHHHFTNLGGGHLLAQGVLQFALNFVYQRNCVNGTLLGCLQDTAEQLLLIKQLFSATLFEDDNLNRFDDLKGCKAFLCVGGPS